MEPLGILIFIITIIIGTGILVKGAYSCVKTENKKKQTIILILTSIILFIINMSGSILAIYSKYLF